MVVAHAGWADAAKWQIVLGDMQQGVVQAHSAGVGVMHHVVLLGPVVAKIVERQWSGALVDVGQGVLKTVIRH
ncbi:hypothetical protein D3C76_1819700 [compost metagenome]